MAKNCIVIKLGYILAIGSNGQCLCVRPIRHVLSWDPVQMLYKSVFIQAGGRVVVSKCSRLVAHCWGNGKAAGPVYW